MDNADLLPVPLRRQPRAGAFRLNSAWKIFAIGETAVIGSSVWNLEHGIEMLMGSSRRVKVAVAARSRSSKRFSKRFRKRLSEQLGILLRVEPGHAAEAYRLEVRDRQIVIESTDAVGMANGVSTLIQLVAGARRAGDNRIPAQTIVDQPRFQRRGVMLDVARHFFTPSQIMRLIDKISSLKLNVLHLHLTDDQGWRLQIEGWPKLTEIGASTSAGGGPGGFYTQDQYRDIVNYAQSKQVTVVPEIDIPGHAAAAVVSYPELGCGSVPNQPYTGYETGFVGLCANQAATDQFIEAVFSQVAQLTPGKYVHIGADETFASTPADVSYFVTKAREVLARFGKQPIGWQATTDALPLGSDGLSQYWGAGESAPALAAQAAGQKLILSPIDRSYLSTSYRSGPGTGLVVDLHRSYDWDPGNYIPGITEADVAGIEAPLWTEWIDTEAKLDEYAFPRLAAIAELAWSPASRLAWPEFVSRVRAQSDLWQALGINYPRDWDAGLP